MIGEYFKTVPEQYICGTEVLHDYVSNKHSGTAEIRNICD
jgi:hypothetical protein